MSNISRICPRYNGSKNTVYSRDNTNFTCSLEETASLRLVVGGLAYSSLITGNTWTTTNTLRARKHKGSKVVSGYPSWWSYIRWMLVAAELHRKGAHPAVPVHFCWLPQIPVLCCVGMSSVRQKSFPCPLWHPQELRPFWATGSCIMFCSWKSCLNIFIRGRVFLDDKDN